MYVLQNNQIWKLFSQSSLDEDTFIAQPVVWHVADLQAIGIIFLCYPFYLLGFSAINTKVSALSSLYFHGVTGDEIRNK